MISLHRSKGSPKSTPLRITVKMKRIDYHLENSFSWLRKKFVVVFFLVVYILFCLQQIDIASQYFDVTISLGTISILFIALSVSIWMLLINGVPECLQRPLFAIIACVISLAASVLASAHPALAFKFAARYTISLLALWAMLNLAVAFPRLPRAAALAAIIALWINLALGISVLLQWPLSLQVSLVFHAEDTFKYLPRISGMYEHPAILAASAVVVATMVIQLHSRGELGKTVLIISLLGAIAALILTQVRNILPPVIALLGWWAWSVRGASRRRRHSAYVTLLLSAGITFYVLWQRYTEMISAAHEGWLTSISLGRTYLWTGALEAWLSHPWFGLGAGIFQFMVPEYTGDRFHRGELHAHNILLAILSETGLCGLIAFAILVYYLWEPLLRIDSERFWSLVWIFLVLSLSVFDFYFPSFAFTLNLTIAIGSMYSTISANN